MPAEFIGKNEPLAQNPIDLVGGKGYNLIRLAQLSEGRDFKVPEFYIIPVGAQLSDPDFERLYGLLKKPLAVRSSSPYEDAKGCSFAGRFKSVLKVDRPWSLEEAVGEVLDSARDVKVTDYAKQHGLTVDDRMAIIVQEMIDPLYAGVCYSTANPNNPRTIVEFVGGLADELMSGVAQGNFASFDKELNLTMKSGREQRYLQKVAKVAKELEGVFGERLDIEFAVSDDGEIYVVQARPITDTSWPHVELPEVANEHTLLRTDIVRGAGAFTGAAFVFRSEDELKKYAAEHNNIPIQELFAQWDNLRDFNRTHPEGFCLIADNLEAHELILKDVGLSNLKAVATVNYASRFSHPIAVVSETGAFYLGVTERMDLLDTIETGDTISMVSDQSQGLIYGLTKPVVEQRKISLEGIPVIPYELSVKMWRPPYEEIDDRLFVDQTGKVGVAFWDYNEERGIPTDVYYNLVDDKGNVIKSGEYHINKVMYRYPDFPSLLNDLLAQAPKKS